MTETWGRSILDETNIIIILCIVQMTQTATFTALQYSFRANELRLLNMSSICPDGLEQDRLSLPTQAAEGS